MRIPRLVMTHDQYRTEFEHRDVIHIDVEPLDDETFKLQAGFLFETGHAVAAGREFIGAVTVIDNGPPVMAFTWARPRIYH